MKNSSVSATCSSSSAMSNSESLRSELVQHAFRGRLEDASARVVVLVHAVPEAGEPEVVVRILGPGDEARDVAAGVADRFEHLDRGLVRAAVQRTPQRVDAGRDRRVEVRVRGADETHGRRRAVLLVVGVQDQQLLQRVHDRRADLVRLGRHREHHPHEVLDEIERVVGVEERLADRRLVRIRGDRRQLRDQADDRQLRVRGIVRVLGVLVEGRHRADDRRRASPSGARPSGTRRRSASRPRAASCAGGSGG